MTDDLSTIINALKNRQATDPMPLIYLLAQRRPADTVRYFNAGFDLASISMRSLLLL